MGRIHLKERKHPLAHDQTWKWGAEDTCAILIFENRNVNSFINCEVICKAFFFFMIQEDDAEMHILDNWDVYLFFKKDKTGRPSREGAI